MTDRIPDEIMREAMRLASMFNISDADIEAVSELHIAPALLARDQRAAEIARRWEQSSWADEVFAARSIADAILSYDEAQQ